MNAFNKSASINISMSNEHCKLAPVPVDWSFSEGVNRRVFLRWSQRMTPAGALHLAAVFRALRPDHCFDLHAASAHLHRRPGVPAAQAHAAAVALQRHAGEARQALLRRQGDDGGVAVQPRGHPARGPGRPGDAQEPPLAVHPQVSLLSDTVEHLVDMPSSRRHFTKQPCFICGDFTVKQTQACFCNYHRVYLCEICSLDYPCFGHCYACLTMNWFDDIKNFKVPLNKGGWLPIKCLFSVFRFFRRKESSSGSADLPVQLQFGLAVPVAEKPAQSRRLESATWNASKRRAAHRRGCAHHQGANKNRRIPRQFLLVFIFYITCFPGRNPSTISPCARRTL